jgi:hypothetical protein
MLVWSHPSRTRGCASPVQRVSFGSNVPHLAQSRTIVNVDDVSVGVTTVVVAQGNNLLFDRVIATKLIDDPTSVRKQADGCSDLWRYGVARLEKNVVDTGLLQCVCKRQTRDAAPTAY